MQGWRQLNRKYNIRLMIIGAVLIILSRHALITLIVYCFIV